MVVEQDVLEAVKIMVVAHIVKVIEDIIILKIRLRNKI